MKNPENIIAKMLKIGAKTSFFAVLLISLLLPSFTTVNAQRASTPPAAPAASTPPPQPAPPPSTTPPSPYSIGPSSVSLSPIGDQAPNTGYTLSGYATNSGGTDYTGIVNYRWDYSTDGTNWFAFGSSKTIAGLKAGASQDVGVTGTVGQVDNKSYSFQLCANDGITQRCATTDSITAYVAPAPVIVPPPAAVSFKLSASGGTGGTISSCVKQGQQGTVSCSGTYPSESVIIITASPSTGYSFSSWTGCASSTASCSVTMNSDKTVTANFTPTNYQLILSRSNGSVTCNNASCAASYPYNSTINFSASPDANYKFDSWGGACSGTAATCSITMGQGASVTANFSAIPISKLTPTITWTPANMTYGTKLDSARLNAKASYGGTLNEVAGTYSYTPASGTVLSVGTHTLSVDFTPDDSLKYNTASKNVTVTVTKKALTVTAEDKTKVQGQPNPPFTSSYSGFVTGDTFSSSVSGSPSYITTANTNSAAGTYTITPAVGTLSSTNYSFGSSSFVAGTLTVNSLPTLDVGLNISGSGSVTCAKQGQLGTVSCSGSYPVDTVIVVTATPFTGYSFSSWTGCTSSTASCTVTLNSAKSVTANFAAKNYTLSLSNLNGSIKCNNATCSTSYPYNSSISLTATPNANYKFDSWGGSCAGTSSSCSIIMGEGANITANFSLIKTDPSVTWVKPANIIYGAALTSGTSGQLNAFSDVAGTFKYTPASGTVLSVGTHTLSVDFTPTSASYNVVKRTTTITVSKKILTVTADNKSKIQGTTNPTLTANYNGFVNGDTASSIGLTPSLSTSATTNSAAGNYVITTAAPFPSPSGTGNYSISYANGIMTITPLSALSVSANISAGGNISCAVQGQQGTVSCSGSYNPNTVIVVTAAPNPGYTFSSWTSCTSLTASCSVTMNSNKAITANFTPINYKLALSNSNGSVKCNDISCSESYPYNSSISLTATPNANYKFDSWGGACSGTAATCSITMGQGASVTANFSLLITDPIITWSPPSSSTRYGEIIGDKQYSVIANVPGTFTYSPAKGTIVPKSGVITYTVTFVPSDKTKYNTVIQTKNITALKVPLTVTADNKTKVQGTVNPTLTVTYGGFVNGDTSSIVSGSPTLTTAATTNTPAGTYTITPAMGNLSAPNYTFDPEGVGVAYNAGTLTIIPLSTLSVSTNISTGGTIACAIQGQQGTVSCSGSYNPNTVIVVTATPAPGYTFSSWAGCISSTATCTVNMSSTKSITANFTPINYKLTLPGITSGTIKCNDVDCATTYPFGTRINLTAVPNINYKFDSWSGACSGTAACSVTMGQGLSVGATFSLINYTLTVAKNGNGNITSSPAGINFGRGNSAVFGSGTSIALTAAPEPDSIFSSWTGCNGVTGNVCTVIMTSDKSNVTASFSLIPPDYDLVTTRQATTPTTVPGVISLSWNRISTATGGYKVYRQTGGNEILWTTISQPSTGTTVTTQNTGLTPGALYGYKVVAQTPSGSLQSSLTSWQFASEQTVPEPVVANNGFIELSPSSSAGGSSHYLITGEGTNADCNQVGEMLRSYCIITGATSMNVPNNITPGSTFYIEGKLNIKLKQNQQESGSPSRPYTVYATLQGKTITINATALKVGSTLDYTGPYKIGPFTAPQQVGKYKVSLDFVSKTQAIYVEYLRGYHEITVVDPSAPSISLVAKTATECGQKINLSWTKVNPNPTGVAKLSFVPEYTIDRFTQNPATLSSNATPDKTIRITDMNQTSYTDIVPSGNKTYWYYIESLVQTNNMSSGSGVGGGSSGLRGFTRTASTGLTIVYDVSSATASAQCSESGLQNSLILTCADPRGGRGSAMCLTGTTYNLSGTVTNSGTKTIDSITNKYQYSTNNGSSWLESGMPSAGIITKLLVNKVQAVTSGNNLTIGPVTGQKFIFRLNSDGGEAKALSSTVDLIPVSTLNIRVIGVGTVSRPGVPDCTSTCSTIFDSPDSVTMTAANASGYQFIGWSENCSGTGACTVKMDNVHRVTATFIACPNGSCPPTDGPTGGGGTPAITIFHQIIPLSSSQAPLENKRCYLQRPTDSSPRVVACGQRQTSLGSGIHRVSVEPLDDHSLVSWTKTVGGASAGNADGDSATHTIAGNQEVVYTFSYTADPYVTLRVSGGRYNNEDKLANSQSDEIPTARVRKGEPFNLIAGPLPIPDFDRCDGRVNGNPSANTIWQRQFAGTELVTVFNAGKSITQDPPIATYSIDCFKGNMLQVSTSIKVQAIDPSINEF